MYMQKKKVMIEDHNKVYKLITKKVIIITGECGYMLLNNNYNKC